MLKILHITNEITKKNFSISSLINYISKQGNEKNFFECDVLCSSTDLNKKKQKFKYFQNQMEKFLSTKKKFF